MLDQDFNISSGDTLMLLRHDKYRIEFCEAARFSMYIDSRSIAYPCSFGIEDGRFSVSLKTHTLQEA